MVYVSRARVNGALSADRCVAKGETADVPAEVVGPSAAVPEMDDLPLLLEKDARWTQNDDSVDPHLVVRWGLYGAS